MELTKCKLGELITQRREKNDGSDLPICGVSKVYEYFLSKFALAEGKGKGEFYTPKCIVNLIAEMLEPYDGILYEKAVA